MVCVVSFACVSCCALCFPRLTAPDCLPCSTVVCLKALSLNWKETARSVCSSVFLYAMLVLSSYSTLTPSQYPGYTRCRFTGEYWHGVRHGHGVWKKANGEVHTGNFQVSGAYSRLSSSPVFFLLSVSFHHCRAARAITSVCVFVCVVWTVWPRARPRHADVSQRLSVQGRMAHGCAGGLWCPLLSQPVRALFLRCGSLASPP